MPITLEDIYRATKSTTFTYEGQEVTIEYKHNALTPVMRIMLAAGSTYIRHKRQTLPAPKKGKRGQAQAEEAPQAGAWWENALEESQAYLSTLAEVLVGWDVLGADGQPLPVTVDWLERMPLSFINAIATAMLTDGLPDPRKGKGSPGTLPPTD